MKRNCPLRGACSDKAKISFSGAVHPMVLVALFGLFLSAAVYLYAINYGAVLGYDTRNLEDEITRLKKDNVRLRISEAELRSLNRVEESVRERFEPADEEPTLEEQIGVALR